MKEPYWLTREECLALHDMMLSQYGGIVGVRDEHLLESALAKPRQLFAYGKPNMAGMAAAYAAGASNLPFGVLRGYAGTDLGLHGAVTSITCPFTGEQLAAIRALRPDVGIIHAQQADEAGNVQIWGITGVQKEAVLASRRSLVTVEEIVPRLVQRPGGIVLPAQAITAVSLAPGGAHPSYAHGFYDRDNAFYVAWDAISRDRETFAAWMQRHVLDTRDSQEYLRSLGDAEVPAG